MIGNFHDWSVQIIGPVPPILEPIYWVGTFLLLLLVIKVLLILMYGFKKVVGW